MSTPLEDAWQLHLDGHSTQAIRVLTSLRQDTQLPESYHITTTLGLIALDTKQHAEAADLFESITQACPKDANAWNNYGLALRGLKRHRDAAIAYNTALTLEPDNVDLAFNLASTLLNMQELSQAQAILSGITQHYPQHSKSLHSLGVIAGIQGDTEAAINYYHRAIQGDESQPKTMANLATILAQRGRAQEAHDWFDKAITIEPNALRILSNRLQNMLYLPDTTLEMMAKAHRDWGQQVEAAFPVETCPRPPWKPREPIRVGYFSSDFRTHSVAYFMEAILKHHGDGVDVFCYFHDEEGDAFTETLKTFNVTWRDLGRLGNDERFRIAAQDKLHMAIELHGHTNNHILPWYTRRIAPIQMTYLGYPFSTGLSCIDYRLTDETVDPVHVDGAYTETLITLQSPYLAYTPQQAPPPRTPQNTITFGCFNNLAKYNTHLLTTWAQILEQVPQSRLLIKNKALADPAAAQAFRTACQHAGIADSQLELIGWLPKATDHLALYGKVDIALDTVPYHGTTTTCEALACGVPVITWVGETPQQRVGKTLLEAVDTPELVAHDQTGYVDCAVSLASDQPRLSHYHQTLAQAVRDSPLCDGQGFVQRLESTYMDLMHKHYHDR